MDFLIGAIIGAVASTIIMIIIIISRQQKFKNVLASIKEPGIEYSAPFFYASSGRYQKSWKVYDAFGVLYLIGNSVYFKSGTSSVPWVFNLAECRVQQEADWRRLKWFSITAANGEKYYFDSFKIGAFSNNSSETLRALSLIQSKLSVQQSPLHTPPPPPPPPVG